MLFNYPILSEFELVFVCFDVFWSYDHGHVHGAFDDIFGDNPPILDNNRNNSNPSSDPSSNSKVLRKDSGTVVKISCLLPYVIISPFCS
jgi:hypothetical protein